MIFRERTDQLQFDLAGSALSLLFNLNLIELKQLLIAMIVQDEELLFVQLLQ